MKFMRITTEYTGEGYKSNKDILSELNNLPSCNEKFKITEINGCEMSGEWTEADRQTARFNCDNYQACGKRSQGRSLERLAEF
jgi:hypothetical protein